MNCKEIIKNYLKDNGYDGLCHVETECGCGLDNLAPCGVWMWLCEPAYKAEGGYSTEKQGDK